MIPLGKLHYDYLMKMINEKDKMEWIQAYCKGAGIITTNWNHGVWIQGTKISICYRRNATYFNIYR